MASFLASSKLTRLQEELLRGFFERESRFHLTGGAALAGFYLGHRATEDLDFFSPPGPSLDDAEAALTATATAIGATVERRRHFPEFRRLVATRADETCVVDLVIDRAPVLGVEKVLVDGILIDPLREIAANKLCTVLSRSEIKDLVDLRALLAAGVDLEQAVADAQVKDGGADPASIAWVIDPIAIGPDARIPGEFDVAELVAFKDELVRKLRALALRDVPRR